MTVKGLSKVSSLHKDSILCSCSGQPIRDFHLDARFHRPLSQPVSEDWFVLVLSSIGITLAPDPDITPSDHSIL